MLLIHQSVGFAGRVRSAAAKDPTPRSGEEGTNGEKRLHHSPFFNSFPLSSNSLTQCAKPAFQLPSFTPFPSPRKMIQFFLMFELKMVLLQWVYRAWLKGEPHVWYVLILMLLAWLFLQHSRNLRIAFTQALFML